MGHSVSLGVCMHEFNLDQWCVPQGYLNPTVIISDTLTFCRHGDRKHLGQS